MSLSSLPKYEFDEARASIPLVTKVKSASFMAEKHLETNKDISEIESLLKYYGFETREYSYQMLISEWLEQYSASWIRLAIIEALYLGRYKTISVKSILTKWSKIGNFKLSFTHDYECFMCQNLSSQIIAENEETTETELSQGLSREEYIQYLFANYYSSEKFFDKLRAFAQLRKELIT